MTEVWRSAPYAGTRLLVLLALADAASDEGVCWPSASTIALKARLEHTRHIYDHLRILEADGWITRKGRSGRSNRYTVHIPTYDRGVAPPTSDVSVTPTYDESVTPTYDRGVTPPMTVASEGYDRGVIGGMTVASPRTIIEPSKNHKGNRQRAHAREPLSLLKNQDETNGPETSGSLALAVAPAPTPPPPPPPPPEEPQELPTDAILYERAAAYVTWGRAKQRMARHEGMTSAQMDSWINPLKVISLIYAAGRFTLTLAAPGTSAAEQVTRRYGGLIATSVGGCLEAVDVDLKIVNKL